MFGLLADPSTDVVIPVKNGGNYLDTTGVIFPNDGSNLKIYGVRLSVCTSKSYQVTINMPCIASTVTSSIAMVRTETYILGDEEKRINFAPFLSDMPSCHVGLYEFFFNGVISANPP